MICGNAPKKSSNVEHKVGIAVQTDALVKVRPGKTHVITVSSSPTNEEIIQKAIEKHRSFDHTFDETVGWVLLYPTSQKSNGSEELASPLYYPITNRQLV